VILAIQSGVVGTMACGLIIAALKNEPSKNVNEKLKASSL
jgi:multisubunit Na+/H+ antiporter MnhB subunit